MHGAGITEEDEEPHELAGERELVEVDSHSRVERLSGIQRARDDDDDLYNASPVADRNRYRY